MSKRGLKAPAPFFKTLPSVIRSVGPRLVIAAAACAVLLLCTGGTYLLSHQTPAPTTKAPSKPMHNVSNDSTEAEVLDASTAQTASNPAPQTTSNPQPAAATSATSDQADTPVPQPSSDTAQVPAQAPVAVSTSSKQTNVHVQVPVVGGLSLNFPLVL